MLRITSHLLLAGLLFASCLTALDAAEDEKTEKKPAEKKVEPNKKIDWGNYVDGGKVVGKIDKTSADGFKLLVETQTIQPGKKTPRTKTDKLDFVFHENGLVRWQKQPVKLSETRKKIPWTPKEAAELKLPQGAPGFAATREDLDSGQVVEVTYMRPKDLKADVAVISDFRVKYVVIVGVDAAATGTKKEEPKKKDDKKKDEKKEEKKEEKK
ncbi:MAG: hypothetical protein ACRC8S_07940 [Fimbriiglobus sp.]